MKRIERSEIVACVFIGVPCIVALSFILPIKNMIGEIFIVSCIVMTLMVVSARIFKKISNTYFKKDKEI